MSLDVVFFESGSRLAPRCARPFRSPCDESAGLSGRHRRQPGCPIYGVADAVGESSADGRLRSVSEARGDGVADSFSDGDALGDGALADVVGVGCFGVLLSRAVAVGVGVLDRVGVGVGVLDRVGVGVGVGVGEGVSLGSGSGSVCVGLGVAVGGVVDGEGDGRAVVIDGLGVGFGVCDGLAVGLAVSVGRGLAVGVGLAEADAFGAVVGPRSTIGPFGRGDVLPVRYGAGST